MGPGLVSQGDPWWDLPCLASGPHSPAWFLQQDLPLLETSASGLPPGPLFPLHSALPWARQCP